MNLLTMSVAPVLDTSSVPYSAVVSWELAAITVLLGVVLLLGSYALHLRHKLYQEHRQRLRLVEQLVREAHTRVACDGLIVDAEFEDVH